MKRFIAGLLGCCMALAASAQTSKPVHIDPSGWSSSPAPLQAYWFAPQGSGARAAVVMLHGCGGAYAKDGSLNARHQMWGELLAAQGIGALMLDSFSSRGVRELCTQKYAERSLKEADRVGDAYAALAWLRQQPGADGARIAVLGWSHGAGVTLDTITHPPAELAQGFAAAVAFYPGCTARAKKAERFRPYAPVLLLIGEADDWTPAAPCVALTQAAQRNGAAMDIVTYPGAYHDFDNPDITQVRLRKDVPNGVNPGQGVHTGPDAGAREAAKVRVSAFLGRVLVP
ncbi:dienelactone hydrolase family protein [Curvibacter sp. APW13]|uniref:dienelactone hydrolase family protein n=1 Tax=Curvibacter sp. APW13 TaxID=3077236 RepID=UPI0028DE7A03|nr:dienelactone hydrolase family protein [Curvibacter sp. APW13]MDT8992055.1 dienelactone hydrolase family protein [Curvibacter sp. APW13]